MSFFNPDKRNRSHDCPEFKGGFFDLSKTEEDIEDPSIFLKVFIDSQVQFKKIAEYLKSGKKIDDLRELNSELVINDHYYTFAEYLNKNKHFFSSNLLNDDDNYASLIDEYNKFIKTMRDFPFKTPKELEHTLNEVKNFFAGAEVILKKLEQKK